MRQFIVPAKSDSYVIVDAATLHQIVMRHEIVSVEKLIKLPLQSDRTDYRIRFQRRTENPFQEYTDGMTHRCMKMPRVGVAHPINPFMAYRTVRIQRVAEELCL